MFKRDGERMNKLALGLYLFAGFMTFVPFIWLAITKKDNLFTMHIVNLFLLSMIFWPIFMPFMMFLGWGVALETIQKQYDKGDKK